MCTSIISNRKKTIVGWNLDILGMDYRITEGDAGVFIEINDEKAGWLPLFGANNRGDFVGMPTCWPFDERSNPNETGNNVIMLDIDLLMQNKTLQEIREIADKESVFSVPGVTFMSSLSDKEGNVLQIVPGQGSRYFEVEDCFKILKAVSQQVCPTVVSMVFDVTDMVVYWCENRQWDKIQKRYFQ